MNLLINIITTAIYIIVTLYFNLPNINNDLYLLHKLYLFVSLVFFQILFNLIYKLANECKIKITDVIKNSIYTAIYCIIGYSIYVDLNSMEVTKTFIENNINDKAIYVFISVIIVTFMTIVKLVEILLTNSITDVCVK